MMRLSQPTTMPPTLPDRGDFCSFSSAPPQKGKDDNKPVPALLLVVVAVLVACAAALLAVSEEAEATFAGPNGKIAYADGGGLYTINPVRGVRPKSPATLPTGLLPRLLTHRQEGHLSTRLTSVRGIRPN